MGKRLFNNEERAFIKENVKGKTSKELADLLNKKFNRNISYKQIQGYKKEHRLRSGIDAKFKKNQKSHNKRPLGSEHINKDGYTVIKVAEPNTWRHKQLYIYESVYGKIPEGYSVMFADSDKTNFDIDNLILVENKDKLTAKNNHLLSKHKELTELGLLTAKLINKRSQLIKNKSI